MMSYLLLAFLLVLSVCTETTFALLPTNPNGPSLVMAFIVRDEEVNIRSNLPAYVPLVDYYVFMVDHRTSDGTLQAIEEILGGKRNYHVEMYDFDGFGPARTASLKQAWLRYPNATHVWIADPDWRADVHTIVKSELTMDADAFRFLIYDRNGFTTRRCDWLIRNRPNNAMRYHLHEVLDIGESYAWKEISWVVHEIEQKGSWHNMVGHTDSHASKRYIFDLMYLEKDLVQYPHDAHTDYYLGVTHHAYVDALTKESGGAVLDTAVVRPSGRSLAEHMELSVKYLTLRATYNYEREFIEERWGVMFLLGTIHGFMPATYNLAESEKWFSMCRDYNPSQMECSINLINVYMMAGLYDKMMREYNALIRTPYTERTMMNHFGLKSCSVPGLAVSVLAVSDEVQKGSAAYDPAAVKYMHALALSLDTQMCHSHDPQLHERSLRSVSQVMAKNGELFRKGQSTLESLCSDQELQNYLAVNAIVQHPCEAFSKRLESAQYCADFGTDMAPPYDSRQIAQSGEFIGAASVFDIAHHAFGGDSSRIFANEKNVYRVLFALYFNPKNVYSLLKQLLDHPDGRKVEIYIMNNVEPIRKDIEQHISLCLSNSAAFSARSSMRSHGIFYLKAIGEVDVKFDYIEYNGGVSKSVRYKEDLKLLESYLSADGVIGVTAFAENKYSREITRLVRARDPWAHVPFSQEAVRLSREYLAAAGFGTRAKKDSDLTSFLAANSSFRLFTRDNLTAELAEHGLSVVSFVPTALSAPYSELSRQAVVQKWKSLGLSEADFVGEFVAPFRYTVYASKRGAALPGRPDLLADPFTMDTVFLDRSQGALGEVFSGLQSQPGAFEALRVPLYAQFKLNSDLAGPTETVSLYLSPDAVAGLSLLPSSPTLSEMTSRNVALRPSTGSQRAVIPGLLLTNMKNLEMLNLISVWKPYGNAEAGGRAPAQGAAPAAEDSSKAALIREHQLKRQEKAQAMKAMGFAQSVIDVALDSDEREFLASLEQREAAAEAVAASASAPSPNTRGIKERVRKPKPPAAADTATGIARPVGGGSLVRKPDGSAVYLGGGVTVDVRGADGRMTTVTGGAVPTLARQTKSELEASYRQKGCQRSEDGSKCRQIAAQVRSTADSATTTLSKVEFDLRQLRFIAFEYPSSAGVIEDYLVFAYQQLVDSVKARIASKGLSNTDLIPLTKEEIDITQGYVNSLIHLTKEPALKEGAYMCHQGALGKMAELADGLLENDFVVMDSLLENRPLRLLTSMLLGSTVWFDASNGQSFFSHSNDGFVFDMASQLANELAISMGEDFVINKYMAVALDLSIEGTTPIFYGMTNEYYAILWLNAFAAPAGAEGDGVVVFGDGSGACLQDHGGSIDTGVHRDFVSVGKNIALDVRALCSSRVDSELIPRRHNRLTLVAPNRAFVLASPGDASLAKKSFDTRTAVAVVLSLSPSK